MAVAAVSAESADRVVIVVASAPPPLETHLTYWSIVTSKIVTTTELSFHELNIFTSCGGLLLALNVYLAFPYRNTWVYHNLSTAICQLNLDWFHFPAFLGFLEEMSFSISVPIPVIWAFSFGCDWIYYLLSLLAFACKNIFPTIETLTCGLSRASSNRIPHAPPLLTVGSVAALVSK